MTENTESFSQKVLAAFPARYDETAEYSRFLNYFMSVGAVLTIAFLYSLHIIPLSFWPFAASDLAEIFWITRSRITFLDAHNKYFFLLLCRDPCWQHLCVTLYYRSTPDWLLEDGREAWALSSDS